MRVIRETLFSRQPNPNVIYPTVVCLLFAWAASQAVWSHAPWAGLLTASGNAVFKDGEYWRLWTTLFVHGDWGHLLSNALLFFVFSYFVGGHLGYVAFPTLAIGVGGLINAAVLTSYRFDVSLVGLSGVVYFLGAFWLTMYLFVERRRSLRARLLRAVGVALALMFPNQYMPQTSYRAHWIGFMAGVAVGLLYFYLHRREIRAAEVTEVLPEEPAPIDVIEYDECGLEPIEIVDDADLEDEPTSPSRSHHPRRRG